MTVSNTQFINAIFGDEAPWCHVTDFPYAPDDIQKDKHLIAWKGDYFSRYNMQPDTNQYFTISTFYCDDQQESRRRKALFKGTPTIVLDDVKEKLSMDEVSKLPKPAWILETSQGSEQWGYILDTPCTERSKVENLLDGLVANGLAPGGKDPGMKGVTRYVRLPEGINNKTSKLVNGEPYKCQMRLWEPFNRVTIEQLAAPFMVDLNAQRRESRVDGAASIPEHPLINIPDIITIKEVRSDGRFDIVCPWVGEHTGADDSGSAIFTNQDGSIGFKCHHGNCQNKTSGDLLRHIDSLSSGFSSRLKNWQIIREFSQMEGSDTLKSPIDALNSPIEESVASTDEPNALQMLCDKLRREEPNTSGARDMAALLLKHVDNMPKIDQIHWHKITCDIMGWSKVNLKGILDDLRKEWYVDTDDDADFYANVIYVKELDRFFDWKKSLFYSPQSFQNSFSSEDNEACKNALQNSKVKKVDRLDYAPKKEPIFTENDVTYGNMWSDHTENHGTPGAVDLWRSHFDVLGWGKYTKHIEQWMAFTLHHPDQKINHMLLLGSGEGCGKDYLLYPLTLAMGSNYTVISGDDMLRDFNDHLLSTKYLHINEAELADRREAAAVGNKLKPLTSAPPNTLRVNQKGIKAINVRNIVNVSMTTNSVVPLKISGTSRRIFAVWSDLNMRDENSNMLPEWLTYWKSRWDWMLNGGWEAVADHLMSVDLSDFNPAEAPPMTEFLREVTDASKPPIEQTITAFIANRKGSFSSDLVTSADMMNTLRQGEMFAPNDMYSQVAHLNPQKIGMALKSMGFIKLKTYKPEGLITIWVLRNSDKYRSMNQKNIKEEYDNQMGISQSAQKIVRVK